MNEVARRGGDGEGKGREVNLLCTGASHLLMTVTLVGGEEEEVTGPSGAGVSTIP